MLPLSSILIACTTLGNRGFEIPASGFTTAARLLGLSPLNVGVPLSSSPLRPPQQFVSRFVNHANISTLRMGPPRCESNSKTSFSYEEKQRSALPRLHPPRLPSGRRHANFDKDRIGEWPEVFEPRDDKARGFGVNGARKLEDTLLDGGETGYWQIRYT
ncbi:hypothetical protein M407DRAFT_31570 [Tulasnella calospora MUT 4182]|uniref:Uncharacterized protein n=1 Tax=Tulasnella calospora MUT 4182 TaxID=1051891 RepID=A0A0C3PV43_9AGAM|nr:hypothetical protein M407DRAFT_31570 [Tulasnella calospora MUT 4182]